MSRHPRRAGRVRSERGSIYVSVRSVRRRGRCGLCTVERRTRERIQDWQRCKEEHTGTQPSGVENNIQIHTKNKVISGTFLADKNYIGNHSAVSPSARLPLYSIPVRSIGRIYAISGYPLVPGIPE